MLGVIQARLGSTRLPGKVLMEIKGKPLLSYCIERVKMACDEVMVLCPAKDFREIWRTCSSRDVEIKGIPGDENDVFGRFRSGLPSVGRFFRICADSPLIDPAVIKHIEPLSAEFKIASNTHPKSWPAGQCVEFLHAEQFHKIPEVALTTYDREHVTPWCYSNWEFGCAINPLGDFSHINMCVDTQEDFDRIADIIGRMKRPHQEYGWREIMEMMK